MLKHEVISTIRGRVWKFGDNVNTDIIYPGRYLKSFLPPEEMAKHALEGVNPDFSKNVKPGDIIVAGRNFGCGSSREEAATCLKAAMIGGVIAESFARIFFRNAVNIGLPVLECKGITQKVKNGDILEVEFKKGLIRNVSTGEEIKTLPLPEFMMEILEKGGLIPYTKEKLARRAGFIH
jgi:3-isopropylmalate/(R)-2-methylmalate dehydratase small subunit